MLTANKMSYLEMDVFQNGDLLVVALCNMVEHSLVVGVDISVYDIDVAAARHHTIRVTAISEYWLSHGATQAGPTHHRARTPVCVVQHSVKTYTQRT